MRGDLQPAYGALREAARRVAKVAADCGMEADVDEYVESFRPGGRRSNIRVLVLGWDCVWGRVEGFRPGSWRFTR